jgi:hypothetical protein
MVLFGLIRQESDRLQKALKLKKKSPDDARDQQN